jgi:hypothetical protein
MHRNNSLGMFFHPEEKTWALSDSTETNKTLCNAFQSDSQMGRAWIVLATSPASKHYDRLCKEYNLGVFIMNCHISKKANKL